MNSSVLVSLAEYTSSKGWEEAFFYIFENFKNDFKNEIDMSGKVRCSIMNLKYALKIQDDSILEDALLKIDNLDSEYKDCSAMEELSKVILNEEISGEKRWCEIKKCCASIISIWEGMLPRNCAFDSLMEIIENENGIFLNERLFNILSALKV